MNPPFRGHEFWFMGSTLKGKLNQSVSETRDREMGGSYLICDNVVITFSLKIFVFSAQISDFWFSTSISLQILRILQNRTWLQKLKPNRSAKSQISNMSTKCKGLSSRTPLCEESLALQKNVIWNKTNNK